MASIFDHITGTEKTPEKTNEEKTPIQSESEQKSDAAELEKRTEKRLRDATQELLKFGLLEESQKPNLYRIVLNNVSDIEKILEPLDLQLGVDDVRGLVFLTVLQDAAAEQDEWSHSLVRRQRFNLEQSLLVAILRQYFIAHEQEAGSGAADAMVAVDELVPQLQIYLGATGSEAKERNRVIHLLDQLKGHGLVSSIDAHDRVSIRPIMAHLANPENLQALLYWLKEQIKHDDLSSDGG